MGLLGTAPLTKPKAERSSVGLKGLVLFSPLLSFVEHAKLLGLLGTAPLTKPKVLLRNNTLVSLWLTQGFVQALEQ